jgi:hypothetical protein
MNRLSRRDRALPAVRGVLLAKVNKAALELDSARSLVSLSGFATSIRPWQPNVQNDRAWGPSQLSHCH